MAMGALRVAQTLVGEKEPPRLWWMTRGAVGLTAEEEVSASGCSVWGLGRTVMLEHPELGCTLVDVSSWHDIEGALAGELGAEDDETQVVWRGGERHVARLVQAGAGASVPLAENYELVTER